MTESNLDDQTFIEQFEQCVLNPAQFNHTGHVRLAWLYLRQNDEKIAIEKVCTGIKAYALSLGVKDKFHLTITYYTVKLIAAREKANSTVSWQQFNSRNSDLITDCIGVLLQYFNHHTLFSEQARLNLTEPDIKAIE